MLKRIYTNIVATCTPNCDEVTRLISESLERSLSLRERILLRLHYGICVMFRRCRDQLESIHNLVRGDGEKIPDGEGAALDQESKGRMKALIEREKGP